LVIILIFSTLFRLFRLDRSLKDDYANTDNRQ
jgi:hypothetical protein